MKANFKKCVTLLMSIVMVFTLFVGTATAAQPPEDEAMPLAGYDNPRFTSATIYLKYQSNHLQRVAHVDWYEGITQPGFITVESQMLNKYRKADDPYAGWYVEYYVNAKDATMIQMKDSSKNVLRRRTPSQNQTVLLDGFIQGTAWREELYYDRTVGGYTVYNIEMGGIRVQ